MIHWITENLGTAKIEDVSEKDYVVMDVRDLVDKEGNSDQAILEKINTVVDLLRQTRKIVICCDYGMSRSNAIAIGAIVKYYNYNFNDAIKYVIEKTRNNSVSVDILNSVRRALEVDNKEDMSSDNKRILLTGGTGFIGRALVPILKKSFYLLLPTRQDIDLLEGPIRLDTEVKNKGADTIVHLANPRQYGTTKSMGQSVIMLKNVLDVCKGNGLDLLYLSSWMVYSGYNTSWLLASESLPLRPKGTYGETKTLCETLLKHYRDIYGLNTYLLRLSPVYGLGSNKPKFIYAFVEKALKNQAIVTHKYLNGLPMVDLIHIHDAVRAIEYVIKVKPPSPFELNIASGTGYSTFEIAKIIKEICGSNSAIMHHEIGDFVANIVMDISKAERILRWHPRINIRDGLREVVNHFIEKGKNTNS